MEKAGRLDPYREGCVLATAFVSLRSIDYDDSGSVHSGALLLPTVDWRIRQHHPFLDLQHPHGRIDFRPSAGQVLCRAVHAGPQNPNDSSLRNEPVYRWQHTRKTARHM